MKSLVSIVEKFVLVWTLFILYATLMFSTIFIVTAAMEISDDRNRSGNALILVISVLVLVLAIVGIMKFRKTKFFQTSQNASVPILMTSLVIVRLLVSGDWSVIIFVLLGIVALIGGVATVHRLRHRKK